MTTRKRELLILTLLHFSLAALLLVLAFTDALAQTCTPPIWGGNTNSCQGINARWLNRNQIADIDRFEVRWNADGVVQTFPASAISASRTGLTCNWASTVTVTQFMKNGGSCATNSTGAAPHTYPCSLCGTGPGSGVSIVSSANYRSNVARNSLVSLFPDPGAFFTDRPEQASSIDLPLTLGGVSVEVNGQQCKLVAVSPGQLNLLLPAELPPGPAELSLTVHTLRGSASTFYGRPQINPNAPGIFTANATGEGAAASVWLVVSLDGRQRYFPPGALPALVASDQVFLLLFGTGINESSAELRLTNGRTLAAQWVGLSIFPGLQQLNFRFPIADIPRGEIGGFVRVFVPSGYTDSQGFLVK